MNYLHSSGIRAVSQPVLQKTSEIFLDNLTNFTVGPTGNYYYFSFPTPDYGLVQGNDATVTYDSINGNLVVDSSVFTKLWTKVTPDFLGALDHVKYLVYRNGSIPLKTDGNDFVYEGVVSAEQKFSLPIPPSYLPGLTNINSDVRLAGSALNLIDYETWLVFDCFFSNETIYAIYERLPFGKPSFGGSGPDYEAFTHLMPLAKRSKTGFDNIKVVINKAANTVRWLVNDVEKFKISDLGMPIDRSLRFNNHGGPPVKVDLKQINVGFGNFSLMDFSNPVSDVSLDLAMVASGNIIPNMPLLQLDFDPQYFDPQRVDRATGSLISVGNPPYIGGTPYDFLVKSDTEPLFNFRNFGQGAVMKIKYIKAYYSVSGTVVPQFPSVI